MTGLAIGEALEGANDNGHYEIDGHDTVSKLLLARCRELGDRTAHREKDFGIWQSYSWNDYLNSARWIGLALKELGLERKDVVSILSEDNKEWMYADMGTVAMGGIVSGVYTTDSASQLAFLVTDSDSKFLFLENDEQLDKYLETRDDMPTLKKVIVFDSEGLRDFKDDMIIFLEDLYELGKQVETRDGADAFYESIAQGKPEDLCMLVYTSGTTGPPKGAMISHGNAIFTLKSGLTAVPGLETDQQICFLPLCHILERFFSSLAPIAAKSTINFAESPETVFENLQEVSPNTFVAVPRVWEKMYSRIQIMVKEATPVGRWAFNSAINAGLKRADAIFEGQEPSSAVKAQYAMWDALVLANLRRMLGMNGIRRAGTGAAPISPELLRWFMAIGVPLFEGYGQTENCGVASINAPEANKLGTVGMPAPGTEIRVTPDGEIQLKGPHVFQGYWKNPERTKETITEDGWLRTGDVGRIDNQGFLTITGRLKDIIITAGGKNITPSEIESQLKFSPYVSDAVIIGDKRKYLTCLVMIDQENVEKFAQDKQVPFSDFASLCAATEVKELIAAEIDRVNKNFARVEQIKDFRLIDILLTAEDEELTPTMKLKRSFVEEKHGNLIESMYAA